MQIVILNAVERASSVWNDNQTHISIRVSERLMKESLNVMNLTYTFHERIGNVENKNNIPVNIRFVSKTSDIRNLSENIRSDQGRTQGGVVVGVNPPFSLIFYKKFITCAKEINCFRILFACKFVDFM